MLGATWIVVLVLNVFFGEYLWFDGVERGIVTVILIGAVIYGFQRSRPVLAVRSTLRGTDIQVRIKIGDIFEEEGALIVGTNTTFDTSMDDGTISPESVQGQFTNKYFSSRVKELDHLLDHALGAVNVLERRTDEEKPYGKRKVYRLGTVVPIHAGERKAYFFAMARFNAAQRVEVDRREFLDALPRLWNGIRYQSGMDDLLCPLLGAGYGGVNAKRVELIGEIVRSFIAACREGRLADNLTIVIRPEDVKQGTIEVDEVGRLLEHECSPRFRMLDDPRPSGHPIE
ncbi:MAG: DUF6430 domain-containing protein [Chloroflexota bacterium]|nr:DUF6430 domain-containing protein [Chloroflexota bacterium]